MSLRAMLWALYDAPVNDPTEQAILLVLADHARDDGTAAWPSRERIADAAQVSVATVKRRIRALSERGVIIAGDQRLVDHYRRDKRPRVWNLNFAKMRQPDVSNHGQKSPLNAGGQIEPPLPSGGSYGERAGGHSYDPQTVLNPSMKEKTLKKESSGERNDSDARPSAQPTASTANAVSAASYPPEFEEFYSKYPRKVGKRAALKAWNAAVKRVSKDDLDAAVTALKRHHELHKTDPRFIPHAATWLNRDGWNDQLVAPAKSGGNVFLRRARERGRDLHGSDGNGRASIGPGFGV